MLSRSPKCLKRHVRLLAFDILYSCVWCAEDILDVQLYNPLTNTGCRMYHKMFPISAKDFTASQRQLVVLEEKTDRSKAV